MTWFAPDALAQPSQEMAVSPALRLRIREEAVISHEQSLDEREQRLLDEADRLEKQSKSLAARANALVGPEAAAAQAVAQRQAELAEQEDCVAAEKERLLRLERTLEKRAAELTAREQMAEYAQEKLEWLHSRQPEFASAAPENCHAGSSLSGLEVDAIKRTAALVKAAEAPVSTPIELLAAPASHPPALTPAFGACWTPEMAALSPPIPSFPARDDEVQALSRRLAEVESLLRQSRQAQASVAELQDELRIRHFEFEEQLQQQGRELAHVKRGQRRMARRMTGSEQGVVSLPARATGDASRPEQLETRLPREERRNG